MRNYDFPSEVQDWIDIVEKDIYPVCKEQKKLVQYVKGCFSKEDIYIDEEQLRHYVALEKYAPFELLPWEKFVLALHDCTYRKKDGMPRWKELFCFLGRGAGKDGMIAYESFCLTSPYNGIPEYDVDICANNEEQAKRPVTDLINWFENPKHTRKIKKFYKWTLEKITGFKTKSVIKGRTNNPTGKDGMRSGIIVFNEIHQYQNYQNIDVFTTGLGKKKHPRISYYTTNGDINEGPLDDMLADSEDILNGQAEMGLLPFICRLDDKKEVEDEKNWAKANPSLPYLPDLMEEIRGEFQKWKKNPNRLSSFMTKRMNLRQHSEESAAVDWELIKKTNKELPDMTGWTCICGIDYMKVSDFASVNLHFKKGDIRYDINHSWICSNSKDLHRIKAPWRDWVDDGHITYVEDVEISPNLITEYIYEMGQKYMIKMISLDNYRYSLLAEALRKIGFSKEMKNLHLVSQMDILKTVPVIDHCFNSELVIWGDNPVLRWGTNNTKTIQYGRQQGADKGSYVYAKIERHSRKTDPFMAFVACMVVEDVLEETQAEIYDIPVIVI